MGFYQTERSQDAPTRSHQASSKVTRRAHSAQGQSEVYDANGDFAPATMRQLTRAHQVSEDSGGDENAGSDEEPEQPLRDDDSASSDERRNGPSQGNDNDDEHDELTQADLEVPMMLNLSASKYSKLAKRRRWTLTSRTCNQTTSACTASLNRNRSSLASQLGGTRDDSSVHYGRYLHQQYLRNPLAMGNLVVSAYRNARCRCGILGSVASLSQRLSQTSPLITNDLSTIDRRRPYAPTRLPNQLSPYDMPNYVNYFATFNSSKSKVAKQRKSQQIRSTGSSSGE